MLSPISEKCGISYLNICLPSGVLRGGVRRAAGVVRRGVGARVAHRPNIPPASGPPAAHRSVGRRQDHAQPVRRLDERPQHLPDQGSRHLRYIALDTRKVRKSCNYLDTTVIETEIEFVSLSRSTNI